MTKIFVPRERCAGESRVAATPEAVSKYLKRDLEVTVEAGAGNSAFFPDSEYEKAGARVVEDGAAGWASADIVLTVGPLTPNDVASVKRGCLVCGLLDPHSHRETVNTLATRGASSIALELLPRITRAQSMDALSSQASIGGYKAVLLAATRLGKYFPLLMTAAGTIKPARVVIMGAGVAGLQAIATARRLGAVVEVSDIREEVKEQVESLGGRFIDLPEQQAGADAGGYAREVTPEFLQKQREIVTRHVQNADVVITTALVPGKKAPVLVTGEMVDRMRPGTVIVDLASRQGGNCELTVADEEVAHNGVVILGPSNLPATMPKDASTLYARNLLELLLHVLDEDGNVHLDREDEIVAAALLTHDGKVVAPGLGAATEGGSA